MLESFCSSCVKVERNEKWEIPTFLRVMGIILEK